MPVDGMGAAASEPYDGTTELPHLRHEQFARHLAAGTLPNGERATAAAAWIASAPPGSSQMSGARQSAHRVSRRGDVQARVRHLIEVRRRGEAENDPGDVITTEGLARLMLRVSDALVQLHKAARRAGLADSKLQAIESNLSRHSSRIAAQIDRLKKIDARSGAIENARVSGLRVPTLCHCAHPEPVEWT